MFDDIVSKHKECREDKYKLEDTMYVMAQKFEELRKDYLRLRESEKRLSVENSNLRKDNQVRVWSNK